ncbi:hypothetical protein BN14_12263 [Rhizoctonia solani AG-1 IB]|uniref:Uncharacterized protein n=1 Tax=Thanatephorus cucumeris (strain AG1-IB / isolate 7/3/14) TaxID=1108050 RepID=M5CDR2_THACB|nr:hypothetical protein BN14_12263 [Rhizoctonia solani AG-1 IB]
MGDPLIVSLSLQVFRWGVAAEQRRREVERPRPHAGRKKGLARDAEPAPQAATPQPTHALAWVRHQHHESTLWVIVLLSIASNHRALVDNDFTTSVPTPSQATRLSCTLEERNSRANAIAQRSQPEIRATAFPSLMNHSQSVLPEDAARRYVDEPPEAQGGRK